MPPYAKPAPAGRRQPIVPLQPKLYVEDIARFDNWDKRECAISNPIEWRARVNDFIKSHGGRPEIPKKIHQIWIGNREPPCIWIDSWRVDFITSHGEGWEHKLWDNEAVERIRDEEEMINADIFDREAMWQCKADLLRLELLYRYGGVYIDADMISLRKSLDDVLESSRETGFGVSYEADTKDKPYSVLGNSIIFASKGHPLLLLLIQYIKMIYDHKRPYYGVEWVTGPLAFTKALLFSDMPLSMIPREYFYATFQYVPNPSAVNTAAFPNSLGFQFGYTCSGLGDWVKRHNKCKKAMDCPYHKAKTSYPFGPISPFPEEDNCVTQGDIPKVIHQFCFSFSPPTRWVQSWQKDFCEKHPGWTHKLWDYKTLVKQQPFLCPHLYPHAEEEFDVESLKLIALEILFKEGGYHVPLTTIYDADSGPSVETSFPPRAVNGMAVSATIVGSVKSGLSLLKAIKGTYELGKQPKLAITDSDTCSSVLEMGFPDYPAAYLRFPKGSRFLGAGEVHFPSPKRHIDYAYRSALTISYNTQVPCFSFDGKSLSTIAATSKSALIVTDPNLMNYPHALDSVSGLIYQTENFVDKDWDFLVLAQQWGTGEDKEVVERAHKSRISNGGRCLGVVINVGRASRLEGIAASFLIPQILAWHSKDRVYIGTIMRVHSEHHTAIYLSMPVLEDVFLRIAAHPIPSWECDERQFSGDIMKGICGNQTAFEICSGGRTIRYKSFNDDGGMNSEAAITIDYAQIIVHHARVFFNHQVIYEGQDIVLPRSV